jgi:hypothetical protein
MVIIRKEFIERIETTYGVSYKYNPSIGLCGCGLELVLKVYYNQCVCGRVYNLNGIKIR